jgi:beta-amylase
VGFFLTDFSFLFFLRQVLKAAWAQGVEVACENALPCYKRSGYDQILSHAKAKGCSKHSLVAFTYLRLNSELMEEQNLREFMRFVHQLHGTILFLYCLIN